MTEIEREFNKEISEKKRTASGAFHRKGGSKSKKCTLPSDHLTEAQKRKLSGPVTTVNLNQPITWKDFKPLSDELKKKYLMDVLNSYKPSARMLGEMLGVSLPTVTKELRRLGLPVNTNSPLYHGSEEFKTKRAMWEAFCNGVVGGGNSIISGANEQIEAQDEQIESEPVQTETQARDLDFTDEEPQITCYDPVAEAEERAKERLVSLMEQGAPQYDEERETQYAAYYDAARDAVDEMLNTPLPAAPAPAVKEIHTRMSALAVRYEGPTDEVSGEIAELMSLFNGTRIKVKLSIEVVTE